MISPELLQFRESNNYVENFREHFNTAERENRTSVGGGHSSNSETSLATTVSRKDNSESDTLEYLEFKDDQYVHVNVNLDQGITARHRGSFGTILTESARRTGTIAPPSVDALNQSEGAQDRNKDKNECDCGRMHPTGEDLRRRSTGSSPISYDEKHYHLGSGSEVLGERRNANRH